MTANHQDSPNPLIARSRFGESGGFAVISFNGRPFDAFRQEIVSAEPSFEVEQDYFDWELAVTGISDMQREIQRLATT